MQFIKRKNLSSSWVICVGRAPPNHDLSGVSGRLISWRALEAPCGWASGSIFHGRHSIELFKVIMAVTAVKLCWSWHINLSTVKYLKWCEWRYDSKYINDFMLEASLPGTFTTLCSVTYSRTSYWRVKQLLVQDYRGKYIVVMKNKYKGIIFIGIHIPLLWPFELECLEYEITSDGISILTQYALYATGSRVGNFQPTRAHECDSLTHYNIR